LKNPVTPGIEPSIFKFVLDLIQISETPAVWNLSESVALKKWFVFDNDQEDFDILTC
jgi:hypothetical protein